MSDSLCKFCLLPDGHTGPHQVQRPVRPPITEGARVRHINGLAIEGTVAGITGYGYAGGEYVYPHAQVVWDQGQPGSYPMHQLFVVNES